MADDFELRFVNEWPAGQLVELYKAGGWWEPHYDTDGLDALVAGSFLFVVAVDASTGRAIGMGRAISDGTSDAWLQDIVVLPDHRGKGIGRAIVKALLDGCVQRGLVWVGIVAEPGTRGFYEPLGFLRLEGEPMVFRRKPDVRD